jgi:hypothetical protein
MDCFWHLIPPKDELIRYRITLTVFLTFRSWREFLEINNDHDIGPSLNTIRLTGSMFSPNETRDGKVISLHSDQPVQLWYHRDTPYSLISNRFDRSIRVDYKWEERKLHKLILIGMNLGCICGELELDATDEWKTYVFVIKSPKNDSD